MSDVIQSKYGCECFGSPQLLISLHILSLFHSDLMDGVWLVRPTFCYKLRLYMSYYCQDAASLAIAIMKKRLRNQIFLGCDNKPLSRSLWTFWFASVSQFCKVSFAVQCYSYGLA